MAAITEFKGRYSFLSNFHGAPVWYRGQLWPDNEHLFQAFKSHDSAQQEWVRQAATPYEAKSRGRKVAKRPDWDQVRKPWMLEIQLLKYTQHLDLRELLIATGNVTLIEGNAWRDDFWGCVPVASRRSGALLPAWGDHQEWTGRNWLGRILMMTRDVLSP